MDARTCRFLALLGLACLLALPPPASAGPGGAAFAPGEQLNYRLTYLGISAASARISVGRELERNGSTVWPLIAQVRTESIFRLYPVKDQFVSWWVPHAGRTDGYDLSADENHQRRRQSVRFEGDSGRAHVTLQHANQPATEKWHDVDPAALDVASATFALRNRELAVGQTHELPIFTGNKQFMLKLTVEAVELRQTELGRREVFRARARTGFGGKLAAKRDMQVYITTDPAHLVVRIEAELGFGSVVADLTQWIPGGARTALGPGSVTP